MNIDLLRREFPHTERAVYFNHAATGPLSRRVMETMFRFMQDRHVGSIENYQEFLPIFGRAHQSVARLLGTDKSRIAFTPNTSYGLHVLAEGLSWQAGDHIAVPACEFPANVYPFMHLERKGVVLDFIPHEEGVFTIEEVERALTPRTKLLSLSWVQFVSGFRADLKAIGQLCQDRGIIFSVDAIQGLGALELSVEDAGIDFLASGAQKWLLAPQGIGFMYVSQRLQEKITPPAGWLHGPVDWDNFYDYRLTFHEDASRFHLGTMNNLGIAALGAALELYFEAGPAWCETRVLERAKQLAEGLDRIGLRRYGSADPAHTSGIVTVYHDDAPGLVASLKEKRISASLRNGLARFSPSFYNTAEEAERTIEAVRAYTQAPVHA